MVYKLIGIWKDVETGKKILISRIHTSHSQIRVKPACKMHTRKKPKTTGLKRCGSIGRSCLERLQTVILEGTRPS